VFYPITDKLKTVTVRMNEAPHNRYIVLDLDRSLQTPEFYTMVSDYNKQTITVQGSDNAGVFYGIQTILSLASLDGTVPHGQVTDHPRFQYRGMHIDVARNFRTVEDIKKLLEVMAMYKMNKFHIHLCDDEGWRLEVPDLPELTEVICVIKLPFG
jgi:hexosaminidase